MSEHSDKPSTSAGITKTSKNKVKEIDPELDITSEKFNPLKALYSKEIKIPTKKIIKFDNTSQFEVALKTIGNIFEIIPKTISHTTKENKVTSSANLSTNKYLAEASSRRFLPHQLPVKGVKKLRNDMFTKMNDIAGPLALLKKYCDGKERVKIYIRKQKGIRGFITGYITAYDKHWNIAVHNAYENYKRRKFCYSETKVILGEPSDCSERLKHLNITLPKTEVKSLNRKYVQITRKLEQLYIRGEHVAIITLDKETKIN